MSPSTLSLPATPTIRGPPAKALPDRKVGKFKLVPGVKQAIDFTDSDGRPRRGIYEIKGDTLRVCLAPSGEKARPTKFATKGTKNTLQDFSRRRPGSEP